MMLGGRYRLLEEIGRGGIGVVHRAEDARLRRKVALKILAPDHVASEEHRRRFVHEARIVASLSHANIAVSYDAGEDDGRLFLVMELLEGETLRERIEGDSLPVEEVVRTGRDIALALAHAHEAGVVHRDLKPENVILTREGMVKVLDFGVAKLRERAATPAGDTVPAPETRAGQLIGTPAYMSPEQAKGGEVDAKSDVFALGVVLYEMLAGRRPFGGTPVEILIAIDRDPPQALSDVPDDLAHLVIRCLEKSPGARPSAKEVAAALRANETSQPRRASARAFLRGAIAGSLVIAVGVALGAADTARARRVAHEAEDASPAPPDTRDPLEVPGWGPLPQSRSREAVAAFAAGLTELRSGGNSALIQFKRALERDPELVAAHVRLAAYNWTLGIIGAARTHLSQARAGRAQLVESDVAIVDALEPILEREPPDAREAALRLQRAAARFPAHVELRVFHAFVMIQVGEPDAVHRSLARWRELTELDPRYGRGWAVIGQLHAYLGDFVEAAASIERCLADWPTSQSCLLERVLQDAEVGRCERLAADARTMVANDPDDLGSFLTLAVAAASTGKPSAAVREALADARMREPQPNAQTAWGTPDLLVDLMAGDFDTAIRGARQLDEQMSIHPRVDARAPAIHYLLLALGEQGKFAEAADLAESFAKRSSAWESFLPAEDFALALDITPDLWTALRAAGRMSRREVESRRKAWLDGVFARQPDAIMRRFAWFHAYAKTAHTAEDAREALAVLPAYEPLPPYRPLTLVEAHVGRTYVLAGDAAAAIPWLERATRKCVHPNMAVEQTRSHYWLGRARASTGDRDGACAAYRVVEQRWGRAKSRLVTLDAARAEMRSLGCR